MSEIPSADDLISGSGIPAISFKDREPGFSVTGIITQEPEARQDTEYGTGKPRFYKDGRPIPQLVIVLATKERDGEGDEGMRRLFANGRKRQAVVNAFRAAGISSAAEAVNGTLTITYTGEGKPSQPGLNPPKQYEAEFAPGDNRGDWGG